MLKKLILAAAVLLNVGALAPTTFAEPPYPQCDLGQSDCPW